MKHSIAMTIILMITIPAIMISQAKYVGIKQCMPCHKGEKNSMVYDKWNQSKHASAYKSLETKRAEEIVKKKGIKGTANTSAVCLACHTTAGNPDKTEGITCEACHGPASNYKMIHSKKGAKIEDALKAGLKLPKNDEKLCIKCHNKNSPTFKSFAYKTDWAKIEHKLVKK